MSSYRLIKNIIPNTYHLYVKWNMTEPYLLTFEGKAEEAYEVLHLLKKYRKTSIVIEEGTL